MVEATIVLEHAIPEELVADVRDKLAYATAQVRRCDIDSQRRRVSVFVDNPAELHTAAVCVRETIAALLHGYRTVDRDVSWRHHAATPPRGGSTWDELVAHGLVQREAQGCVALLGDACRVALALDRRFETMARTFEAVPHQYPTLLPVAALERCDYFASFPHHLTFAPHLVEDVDRIRHVGGCASGSRPAAVMAGLAPPTHVLSPSVCFHTYAALADSAVATNRAFTAVQRCHRWEAANLATLERLWDFTMREIVFVGDAEWVEGQRQRAITETTQLVEELALEAWTETANDPFFVGNFAAKRYFQLLRRAKVELRLATGPTGASVAAASFNVHEDFFGRSFAIQAGDGEFVATGCAGFGIERWVWALYSHHGPEVAQWPRSVRVGLGL